MRSDSGRLSARTFFGFWRSRDTGLPTCVSGLPVSGGGACGQNEAPRALPLNCNYSGNSTMGPPLTRG
jgi:hypothetical protein